MANAIFGIGACLIWNYAAGWYHSLRIRACGRKVDQEVGPAAVEGASGWYTAYAVGTRETCTCRPSSIPACSSDKGVGPESSCSVFMSAGCWEQSWGSTLIYSDGLQRLPSMAPSSGVRVAFVCKWKKTPSPVIQDCSRFVSSSPLVQQRWSKGHCGSEEEGANRLQLWT